MAPVSLNGRSMHAANEKEISHGRVVVANRLNCLP